MMKTPKFNIGNIAYNLEHNKVPEEKKLKNVYLTIIAIDGNEYGEYRFTVVKNGENVTYDGIFAHYAGKDILDWDITIGFLGLKIERSYEGDVIRTKRGKKVYIGEMYTITEDNIPKRVLNKEKERIEKLDVYSTSNKDELRPYSKIWTTSSGFGYDNLNGCFTDGTKYIGTVIAVQIGEDDSNYEFGKASNGGDYWFGEYRVIDIIDD